MMKIQLIEPKKPDFKKEAVLVFPFFSKKRISITNKVLEREVNRFYAASPLLKENEMRFAFYNTKKIILLNVGKREKWSQRKFLVNIRKIIRFLKSNNIKEAVLFLEQVIPAAVNLFSLVRRISEDILLADYEFIRYKEEPKEGWARIKSIKISLSNPQRYQDALRKGEIIGQCTNFARDLANMPGGEMTPEKLADAAAEATKNLENTRIEIFNEKKLRELKMGGILGVSRGSSQKPRLIVIQYFGASRNQKFNLAFVGKGITFDTGGLSIKPSEHMGEMHMDMSGGAAVLGSILAIVKLKLPINIVGLIPAVENMPSGQSYRPGDILRAYNGKAIEVLNTDAEGRIVLADALSYAARQFKPNMIVDVATLTGAAMVALGQRAIGLFSNRPEMEKVFRQIGEDSGDYVWPLPTWEEYEEEIKGTFGDISNVGKTKYGGAITAALFLKNFVTGLPWIHLDIAPTMTSIENQGLSKGATGTGVRYLVELAQDFKTINL